jgi:hypothetical protein
MKKVGDGIVSLIAICCAFLCYVPLLFDWKLLDPFDFNPTAIPLYHHSIIASIALAFPLSIDVIFNHDLPWRVILSRWILLSSLILPNILILSAMEGHSGRNDNVIICNTRARQILCGGGLLTMYDRKIPYQRKFRLAIAIVGAIANVSLAFYPFLHTRLLTILCGLGSLLMVVGCLLSSVIDIYSSLKQPPKTFIGKYCLLQSILLGCNVAVKVLFLIIVGRRYGMLASSRSLTIFLYSDSITAVLAFMVPNRMAIEEASVAKVFPCTLPLDLILLSLNSSCTKLKRTLYDT